MGKLFGQTIKQRRYIDDKKIYEIMFNITREIKNHNALLLYIYESG